jgi:hypothetical protein
MAIYKGQFPINFTGGAFKGNTTVGGILLGNNLIYGAFTASAPGPPPLDPDAEAFLLATGITDPTIESAINDLVIDLKNDSLWTKMKVIYPMVGGGNPNLAAAQAACEQNLVSSSFTGSFTSGWTFASTGVTPNGTSAYMDTGLLPSISLTNNSTALSFYSRSTSEANVGVEMGAAENPSAIPLIQLVCNYTGLGTLHDHYSYLNGRLAVSTANSFGFFCGSRTSSTSLKGYKNGSLVGTLTTSNSQNVTVINRSLFIGAVNLLAGTDAFSNRECAFASIGDGLNDTEASNLYTAVQAFQTTLSRQL